MAKLETNTQNDPSHLCGHTSWTLDQAVFDVSKTGGLIFKIIPFAMVRGWSTHPIMKELVVIMMKFDAKTVVQLLRHRSCVTQGAAI